MKKVVLASFAKFPEGDSNAVHFLNIGSIFFELGYEVSYVGFGKQELDNQFGKVYSLASKSKSRLINRINSHLNMDSKLLKFLFENFIDADVVIIAACLSKSSLNKLRKFYAKHSPKTQLIISMTEAYTRDEFDNFNYFTKRGFKRNQYLNNDFEDKYYKVICISKYLKQSFDNRGFKTIYLPFIFSKKYIGENNSVPHGKINYLYAGSPDNKDMLLEIIKTFMKLPEDYQNKIEFNIVGVTKDWLSRRDQSLKDIPSFIKFHGRVSRDEVVKFYEAADYSVLLRDESKQFVKAGCPTKIVESLFYGVPPVTNSFGDLSDYLVDSRNSFISNGHSIEEFKDTIIKSINNHDLHEKMKKEALKTAYSCFETNNYIDSMKEFLKDE